MQWLLLEVEVTGGKEIDANSHLDRVAKERGVRRGDDHVKLGSR